jgi:hypothetical protein
MKKIDKMPDKEIPTWLDGKPYEFTRGVDFDMDATRFRTNLVGKARNRNIKITTRVVGDTVYVQAILNGKALR